MTVGKLFKIPSKPKLLALSSSIPLKVIIERTKYHSAQIKRTMLQRAFSLSFEMIKKKL